jgi:cell division protein FtsB
VSLLKSDSLDPDLIDERARALLDYVDPRDVVVLLRRP